MIKKTLVAVMIGAFIAGLVGCGDNKSSSTTDNGKDGSQTETITSDKDYWACLDATINQDNYRVDITFQDENKRKYNFQDIMLVNTYNDKKYVSMMGDVSYDAEALNMTYDERVAVIKEVYGMDVDESSKYFLGIYCDNEGIIASNETSTHMKQAIYDEDYYDVFFKSLIGKDASSIIGKRLSYIGSEVVVPYEVLIAGVKNVMDSYEKDMSLDFVSSYKKTDSELFISFKEKGFYEWCLENVEEFEGYDYALSNKNLIKDKDDIKLTVKLSGEFVSIFEIVFDVIGCNDVAFKLDFTKTNDMEGKELAEIFDKSVEETVVGDWKYSLTKFLEYKLENNVDTIEFKYGFDVNDCNMVIEYAKDEAGISRMINTFDQYSYSLDIDMLNLGMATDEEFDNAYTAEELIELIKNY